jgi:hypothetical protein
LNILCLIALPLQNHTLPSRDGCKTSAAITGTEGGSSRRCFAESREMRFIDPRLEGAGKSGTTTRGGSGAGWRHSSETSVVEAGLNWWSVADPEGVVREER